MDDLKLINILYSATDNTRKLIFTLDRESGPVTIEVGAIQKGDGKNILCVPTQTNCAQACKFCFTTDLAGKVAVTNLTWGEMLEIVKMSWIESGFCNDPDPLLVSFMGVGEPMANTAHLVKTMINMRAWGLRVGLDVRFGVATMLPAKYVADFVGFSGVLASLRLPVKVHLSLHYPTTLERNRWMPSAAPVGDSVSALQGYRKLTKNPIEIHYTLIGGINDSLGHAAALRQLLEADPVPVKLLKFNPMPGDTLEPTGANFRDLFCEELAKGGIPTEFYASPGSDISAACGMFMTDAYIPTRREAVFVAAPARPNNYITLDEVRTFNDPLRGFTNTEFVETL